MSDYYTPPIIIDTAREFFQGSIDIDLCSDEKANGLVEAKTFFTDYRQFDSNSIAGCNIWCNPPYQRDFITTFFVDWYPTAISKALDNGCEILTLVNAQTSAKWFHSLLKNSDSIGFFYKRISFVHPDSLEIIKGNRYDQMIFMGSKDAGASQRFYNSFGSLAAIIDR